MHLFQIVVVFSNLSTLIFCALAFWGKKKPREVQGSSKKMACCEILNLKSSAGRVQLPPRRTKACVLGLQESNTHTHTQTRARAHTSL